MARFTLAFDFSEFDGDKAGFMPITIEPLIQPYPSPEDGTTFVNNLTITTDLLGKASTQLASLPGLQYRIESWATGEQVIPGEWPDETIVRYEEISSVSPSPILPVDAAAVRQQILSEVEVELAALRAEIEALREQVSP